MLIYKLKLGGGGRRDKEKEERKTDFLLNYRAWKQKKFMTQVKSKECNKMNKSSTTINNYYHQ